MPSRLIDFEMDEGSIVDNGAHPGAKVLIKKNHPVPADISAGERDDEDDTLHRYERLKMKRKKRLKTQEAETGMVPDEPSDDDEVDTHMADENNQGRYDREALVAKGLDPDVIDYIEDLEAYADNLEAKVSKADDEPDEPVLDEVVKNLDPAVAEIVSKSVERANELEQRLEAEIAKRREHEEAAITAEYVELAKSYRGLPIGMSAEDFGEVLKSLAHADPDNFDKIADVLDAADKSLANSAYLDEIGKRGFISDDSDDAGERKARHLVSKGDAPDIETARVMVLEQNPDLYDATQRPGR